MGFSAMRVTELTVRRFCDSWSMRPLPGVTLTLCCLSALLLAGCGSVRISTQGVTPTAGSVTSVQVVRGSLGGLPPDVAETIDRAIRQRLESQQLPPGNGAIATWRVLRSDAGSRAGSALTLGFSGSAEVVIGVRLTTPTGQLIQEFEAAGSDNSQGSRQLNAGAFAGRAAADQIAQVVGRR